MLQKGLKLPPTDNRERGAGGVRAFAVVCQLFRLAFYADCLIPLFHLLKLSSHDAT